MSRFLRGMAALFLITGTGSHASAQKFNPNGLAITMQKAIQKASAASVRMWSFDVDKQIRTGGQFSGVVVTASGHILTAAHVNKPGQTYKVMFQDGSEHIAQGLGEIELEGNPSAPDVAMMKIIGPGTWPCAEMGWSYSLKKYEPCISIAYPESLNQSLPMVRFGYVAEVQNKQGFITSTCIMEPGDSGGPLFDYHGRLIGLHSAIDLGEKDNFEVPVDLYRKYWTALNKAETYTVYPALKDDIGADPMAAGLKGSPELEKLELSFRKSASRLRGSVYLLKSVLDGQSQKVQATVIQYNGSPVNDKLKKRILLVSKSSLVGENPVIELEGEEIAATVIARDKNNDLILLLTAVKLKGGIKLSALNSDTLTLKQLGKFLISPQSNDTYKISVIGSAAFELPKMSSAGYLGAGIGFQEGKLSITMINPDSPASKAELLPGDQIVGIDKISIVQPLDFISAYQKYWPGDKIALKITRKDSASLKDTILIKEVTLRTMPKISFNHPGENFSGGKSIRRDGLSKVFSHDATLKPEQCGGPVFDATGHFFGINIARYSRVSSLVMPASLILQLIKKYDPKL
ncbi:serine protease Do [Pedobacter sp. ok626]|uniref:trypsin-like peptidase domain-containing protein n=1 Tax=Pedobacter sp. ok626 TaxID=1761882 RepID=UPI00088DADFD|nr:trypsin-like peptidase domain-containing protein [Pedobacter sp. ok626]SDJ34533.1 serine protease Do [Pedobacter sp. ok626]